MRRGETGRGTVHGAERGQNTTSAGLVRGDLETVGRYTHVQERPWGQKKGGPKKSPWDRAWDAVLGEGRASDILLQLQRAKEEEVRQRTTLIRGVKEATSQGLGWKEIEVLLQNVVGANGKERGGPGCQGAQGLLGI